MTIKGSVSVVCFDWCWKALDVVSESTRCASVVLKSFFFLCTCVVLCDCIWQHNLLIIVCEIFFIKALQQIREELIYNGDKILWALGNCRIIERISVDVCWRWRLVVAKYSCLFQCISAMNNHEYSLYDVQDVCLTRTTRLVTLYLGQRGWSGSGKNIHLLTPIFVCIIHVPPFNMIHSILIVLFWDPTVFFHNLCPGFLSLVYL